MGLKHKNRLFKFEVIAFNILFEATIRGCQTTQAQVCQKTK